MWSILEFPNSICNSETVLALLKPLNAFKWHPGNGIQIGKFFSARSPKVLITLAPCLSTVLVILKLNAIPLPLATFVPGILTFIHDSMEARRSIIFL